MEKDILKKKIVDCELSVRAINCLKAAGIETVGDLCQKDPKEIRKIQNLGGRTFCELDDLLDDNGLGWGMDVENENPFDKTERHNDEVMRWVVENCAKRYDADMADRIFLAIRDIACDNEENKADSNKVFVVLAEVVARFFAMNLHIITDNLGKAPDFTIQDMAKMFHYHVRVFCTTKYEPDKETINDK